MENQSTQPTIPQQPLPQPNLTETLHVTPIKKTSKILIAIIILLFLALYGIAGYFIYQNYQFKKENSDRKIGGHCSYDEFLGKCKIVDIQNTTAKFMFSPDNLKDARRNWYPEDPLIKQTHSEAIGYLGLKCLKDEKGITKYPITSEDIERCGLKPNAVFDCEISIIKGGTCSPINFTFLD